WSLYAGFPETAYIDGLLTGLWVLARLSGLDNRQKAQFIQRLCFSVAGGLACSVPLLIPFAEFLTRSYVGGHDGAFAHASLPSASAALSLMPWVFGPIFLYNDPSNIVTATWGSIGGYLPALELALALLGMQRTQGRLRLALMAWMLLCLCKTYDIRPVSNLMNLRPMVGSAAFFRYSPPSWEFAGAALAALAVDGLERGIPLTRSRATLTFGTALAIVLAALWLARHQIDALIRYGSYYIFLAAALGWLAVSLLTGLAAILLCNRWKHGIHLLTFMLAADACIAFALPIGSGAWNVRRQEPGVAFLREHIGLQRVYTLGPLAPNYGAFFKIAQINHNYLPVSKNWVDYIHQHLDPGAGYTGFIGDAPRKDRKSTAAEQLRERRSAYEELGVKYILAAPGVDPLANALRTKHKAAGYDQVLQLKNDQGIVVHWDVPGVPEQRAIDRITVLTGTYGNQSNGVLIAQVCVDGGHCVKGHRAFAGSVDNAPLAISLDHPLAVPERSDGTSVPLTITLTQHQSTFPAVVWLSALDARANQNLSLDGAPSGVAPTLTLEFNASDTDAISRLAYEGSDMSIHQLLNTKPYFEVIEGACSLHALSRVSAETDCSTPGRLLRREATYPGWRAAIDGKAAPVTEARELFQSVALPTGKHRIVFTYRPTYFGLICAGFAAGLLTLLYGAWRELSYWREGRNERWRQPPEGRDPAASAART
ncbi:MAG TPA: YfhO family protein, partial [Acetobacteraceae bacterium]